MVNNADFHSFTQWSAILTGVCGALATLGFIFKWGIRFRLVGITSFMGVLTASLFALGLVPFTRTVIPGAVHFSMVFDNGGNQTVITVPSQITQTELEATLRQAASDLFSYGRLGGGTNNQLTIRARTIIHPKPGVSKPLVLGEVKRSLATREDEQMVINIYPQSFAQLPKSSA
ncbi:MAG TPA: Ycf51 family protein [Stenomitos sp.]